MSLPPFGAITKPVDQARFDGRQIVNFPYKSNGPGYLANPRDARRYNPTQLFSQKFDGSARVPLTSTPYSHRDPQVSPDGKWIAFVADAKLRSDSVVQAEADSLAMLPFDKARDAAARNDNEIFVVAVAGGEPRKLATIQGDESSIEWSPDSKSISFLSRPTRTANAVLLVADATTGAARNMTAKWQYEPANTYWLPNGNIYIDNSAGTQYGIYAHNAGTGAVIITAVAGKVIDPAVRPQLYLKSAGYCVFVLDPGYGGQDTGA